MINSRRVVSREQFAHRHHDDETRAGLAYQYAEETYRMASAGDISQLAYEHSVAGKADAPALSLLAADRFCR